MTGTACAIANCNRPVRRGTLCDMHYKRRLRGISMDAPAKERLTPTQRLHEASLALADAEEDDEYQRASERQRKAVDRYAANKGWSPPADIVQQSEKCLQVQACKRSAALARAAKLSPRRRAEIARNAALDRWMRNHAR
jgi:hypothetical protein